MAGEGLNVPPPAVQPPVPGYRDICRRFYDLRNHSRQAGKLLTVMSLVSSVIVLASLLYGGVLLAKGLAQGGLDLPRVFGLGLGLVEILLLIQFAMFSGFIVWMLVMSVLTLLNAWGLFARQKALAMEELFSTSIGLAVVDDGLWQRVTDRFRRGWRGTMLNKHHYSGIETHVFLCACHWESLLQICNGEREPRWYRFNQSQQSFQTLKFFYRPKTWQIVLACIGALLLIFHLILITLITTVFYGMRYITVYARINALCDFFIGDR